MVKIMNGIGQIVEGINASFEALKNNRVRKLHVLKNIDNESYKLKKNFRNFFKSKHSY